PAAREPRRRWPAPRRRGHRRPAAPAPSACVRCSLRRGLPGGQPRWTIRGTPARRCTAAADRLSGSRTIAPRSSRCHAIVRWVSYAGGMVVFSNRRLGPSAELLVSHEAAGELLREVAAAAGPWAQARWEHELVEWLEHCAVSHG